MRSTTRPIASVLALLVLTAGLLAGCGGGEGSEGDAQGGSQDGGGEQQQGGPEREARETKIGLGNVVAVDADKRRMVVKPSQQAEGAERLTINVRKNAEITLAGREAEMGDAAEGQQAQVEYVTKNDVNRAVSVQLFEVGDQQDQPSEGEGTSN